MIGTFVTPERNKHSEMVRIFLVHRYIEGYPIIPAVNPELIRKLTFVFMSKRAVSFSPDVKS